MKSIAVCILLLLSTLAIWRLSSALHATPENTLTRLRGVLAFENNSEMMLFVEVEDMQPRSPMASPSYEVVRQSQYRLEITDKGVLTITNISPAFGPLISSGTIVFFHNDSTWLYTFKSADRKAALFRWTQDGFVQAHDATAEELLATLAVEPSVASKTIDTQCNWLQWRRIENMEPAGPTRTATGNHCNITCTIELRNEQLQASILANGITTQHLIALPK